MSRARTPSHNWLLALPMGGLQVGFCLGAPLAKGFSSFLSKIQNSGCRVEWYWKIMGVFPLCIFRGCYENSIPQKECTRAKGV